MPSLNSRMYTLSTDAYNQLLTLKSNPNHPPTNNEWDGESSNSSPLTYQFDRRTLSPHLYDNPTRGLSTALNLLATTPIEEWISSLPTNIQEWNAYFPTTPPLELTTTPRAARIYLTNNSKPSYKLQYFDHNTHYTERRRYKLALNTFSCDYYFRLAHRFNMKPFHQGGRNIQTAYVSVCLEAIGLQYIIIREDININININIEDN